MDAINHYLGGHRSRKMMDIEQELSLPKIPEKPLQSAPRTTVQPRSRTKIKVEKKFVSETTLSPEQEHLHDQIKITLGAHKNQVEPYLMGKVNLPKLPRVQKSKSTSQYMSLSKILSNPNNFINNYFTDINNKRL